MRRRVTGRGAARRPVGGRGRMGRGPVRSRPRRSSQAPKGVSTGVRRTASARRPAQRLTAQQRAGLAARRRPSTRRATPQRGALAAQRRAARRGTSLRRSVSPARRMGGRGSRRINQANLRMSRARRI